MHIQQVYVHGCLCLCFSYWYLCNMVECVSFKSIDISPNWMTIHIRLVSLPAYCLQSALNSSLQFSKEPNLSGWASSRKEIFAANGKYFQIIHFCNCFRRIPSQHLTENLIFLLLSNVFESFCCDRPVQLGLRARGSPNYLLNASMIKFVSLRRYSKIVENFFNKDIIGSRNKNNYYNSSLSFSPFNQ